MAGFEKDYFDAVYGGDYGKRNPRRKLRYYLREINGVKPSGNLIDIGCAYGLFASEARKYYDVAGCDISGHAVEEARKKFADVRFYHSSLDGLDTGRKFDIATCFDILEHVKDLDSALEKIRDLLAGEGIIVLTVPVYDTIVGRAVGMLDKDETHIWKKGRGFWKDKLMAHGFKIVKDIGLWRYFIAGRFYIFFGGSIWRNFSPAILLIGRKEGG